MPEITKFTGAPDASAREPITFDIALRITVSPDGWDLAYGTGTLPEAVRDDVTRYVLTAAQHLTATSEGAITQVVVAKSEPATSVFDDLPLGPGEDGVEVWIPPKNDCLLHQPRKPCPHCKGEYFHVRTRRCPDCGRRP